jgi:hypothetical protein
VARWQPFAAGVFMIMDVFEAVESRFPAFDSAVSVVGLEERLNVLRPIRLSALMVYIARHRCPLGWLSHGRL